MLVKHISFPLLFWKNLRRCSGKKKSAQAGARCEKDNSMILSSRLEKG